MSAYEEHKGFQHSPISSASSDCDDDDNHTFDDRNHGSKRAVTPPITRNLPVLRAPQPTGPPGTAVETKAPEPRSVQSPPAPLPTSAFHGNSAPNATASIKGSENSSPQDPFEEKDDDEPVRNNGSSPIKSKKKQKGEPADPHHKALELLGVGPTEDLWIETQTPDGKLYFYHSVTRQTLWERPHKAKVVTQAQIENAVRVVQMEMKYQNKPAPPDSVTAPPAMPLGMLPTDGWMPTATMDPNMAWTAHTAEDGRVYYFNTVTQESTWQEPQGFVNIQAGLSSSTVTQLTEPNSKPEHYQPVADTNWFVVFTGDNKVFYYNSETKDSVWLRPTELKGRPEIDKWIQEPPYLQTKRAHEGDDAECSEGKKAKMSATTPTESGVAFEDRVQALVQDMVLEKQGLAPMNLPMDTIRFRALGLPTQGDPLAIQSWLMRCMGNFKTKIIEYSLPRAFAILEFTNLQEARNAYSVVLRNGIVGFDSMVRFEPIPMSSLQQRPGTGLPKVQVYQCWHWPSCNNPMCKYRHPAELCKFVESGQTCPRGAANCSYAHHFCSRSQCTCGAFKNPQFHHNTGGDDKKKNYQCVFWPNCIRGDDCKRHHPPSMCKFIENGEVCPYGAQKCFYGHSFCNSKARCVCPEPKDQQLNHNI